MVVCARCKKEMRCIKTGMTVRFREEGEHAYAGDMLECPECKATIAVTNPNSFYDEGAKSATDWDVWMDADNGFKLDDSEKDTYKALVKLAEKYVNLKYNDSNILEPTQIQHLTTALCNNMINSVGEK